MAEQPTSGRKNFLSKSKWGKVLKPNDDGKANFQLNEDVKDFLKPSTERYSGAGTRPAQQPRIDPTVAQRYPQPHDRLQDGTAFVPSPLPAAAGAKPRRRKNLVVRFAQTPPEIIGHGGDETGTPSIDVARARAGMVRSQSDRKPSMPLDNIMAPTHDRLYRPGGALQRAMTHLDNRPSPASYANPLELYSHQQPDHALLRPGMTKRTPTGIDGASNQGQIDSASSGVDMASDGRLNHTPTLPGAEDARYTLQHDSSPRQLRVRRSQQEMRQEEGKLFKRAVRLSQAMSPGQEDFYTRQTSVASPEKQNQLLPIADGSPQSLRKYRSPRLGSVDLEGVPPGLQRTSIDSETPRERPSPQSSLQQSPPQVTGPRSRNQSVSDSPTGHQRAVESHSREAQGNPQTLPQHPANNVRRAPPQIKLNDQRSDVVDQGPYGSQGQPGHDFSQPGLSPRNFVRPFPSPSSPGAGVEAHYFPRQSPSPRANSPASNAHDSGALALAEFRLCVTQSLPIFNTNAQREMPSQSAGPYDWLRCALWWFHAGKTGLERLVKERSRSKSETHVQLSQAHVDLAKAWWLVTEWLAAYDITIDSMTSGAKHELERQLEAFAAWMDRQGIMPGQNSSLQDQDHSLWIAYPTVHGGLAQVLNPTQQGHSSPGLDLFKMMPLGDTGSTFCYRRMFVNGTMNTGDAASHGVNMACLLTVVRDPKTYDTSLVIASQNNLINIQIVPSGTEAGKSAVNWKDVAWKSRSHGFRVCFPNDLALSIDMGENDFEQLWSMAEYSKHMMKSFEALQDELLVYRCQVAEGHFDSNSAVSTFPKSHVRGCILSVFEKQSSQSEGQIVKKLYRGYRVVLSTPTSSKALSTAEQRYDERSPVTYVVEDATRDRGNEALILYGGDGERKSRMRLVFKSPQESSALIEILRGSRLRPNEFTALRCKLAAYDVSTAEGEAVSSPHRLLPPRSKQDVTVINKAPGNGVGAASTVMSDSLRVLVGHAGGTLTDRMTFLPGELLLRLPVTPAPAIEVLRHAQKDMTVLINQRATDPVSSEQYARALQVISERPTVRSYTFDSFAELHNFQHAITGLEILFDGACSQFSISRRRAVVSIHKKWEASNVRLQVVKAGGGRDVTVLAFFEGFSHSEAMVINLKSKDVFEKMKPDKSGKHAVKLVEAQFGLTTRSGEGRDEEDGEHKLGELDDAVRRRYLNLEGLDFLEERDDIVVGFDAENVYDQFCKSLPAEVTSARSFTLMRRI